MPLREAQRPFRAVALLGAPLESEARAESVNLAPRALRAAGLVAALETAHMAVEEHDDLEIAVTDPRRDPDSGIIALEQVRAASEMIDHTIASLLDEKRPLLVLGGCCGVLVGIAAALQRFYDRVGLAFVDGHYDFYDGATSPTGGALADMELRVLAGKGPPTLTRLGARHPLVEPRDVWIRRSSRRLGDARGPGSGPARGATGGASRRRRRRATARARPRRRLCGPRPQRATLATTGSTSTSTSSRTRSSRGVDFRLPGGLSWDELRRLLVPLATAPGFLGMDVTIYDPTLDPERISARAIVGLLTEVLAGVRR